MWLLSRRYAIWGSKVRIQVGSAEDRLIQALRKEPLDKTSAAWCSETRSTNKHAL